MAILSGCGPSPSGTPSSATVYSGSSYNFNQADAVTVDSSGNVWVANEGNSTLTGIGSFGYGSSSVATYSGQAVSSPVGVATTSGGNIWVANAFNNTVSQLNSCYGFSNTLTCTTSIYQNPSGSPVLAGPSAIYADPSQNIWVTGAQSNTLAELSPPSFSYNPDTATNFCNTGNTDTDCTVTNNYGFASPMGVVADASGNLWIVNAGQSNGTITGTASVTEIPGAASNSSGTPILFSGAPYSFSDPVAITADEFKNIWIVNKTGGSDGKGSLTILPAGCSPSHCAPVILRGSPYAFSSPVAIATDSSGNAFVANNTGNSVTEVPAGCLAGSCTPIIYSGPAYQFASPVALTYSSGTLWVVSPSTLTAMTPLTP